MKRLTADLLIPMDRAPVKDGVVVVDDQGHIVELGDRSSYVASSLQYYRGALIPGWVNAHCHLELSHMRGIIPSGTGLIDFIKSIVLLRNFEKELVKAAIIRQDRYMREEGIVAVGDISNLADTAEIKKDSSIRYHSFVECFDLLQEEAADEHFEAALELFDEFKAPKANRVSIVPHASYSVSPTLFRYIRETNPLGATISIHNQETPEEDRFFRDKTGGFAGFYRDFGLSIETFEPTGKSALESILPYLSPDRKTLFVHNTCTTAKDIRLARERIKRTYWATCPNANLYIENRLPDYKVWLKEGATICVGTDSLSSNWQLSVLEEVKTILRFNSFLDWLEVLKWATLHGAQALSMDDTLGSLTPGKSPGILHLDLDIHAPAPMDTLRTSKRIV